MQHTPARRLFAGLAVAGAVVGMGSAPAIAAPKAAGISIYLLDVTAPVGGRALLLPSFWSDRSVTVKDPAITYELSGGLTGVSLLAGGADDGSAGDCKSVSPTQLTCTSATPLTFGKDGQEGWFEALVEAGDTAVPGASGTLKATFSGKDTAAVTVTGAVRVAEAVDLTAGATATAAGNPGQAVQGRYSVRNSGAKAVTGVSAIFFNDRAIQTGEQYSNCLYADGDLLTCTFGETLEPDATYETALSYKVRPDSLAPGFAAGHIQWVTPAELEDFYGYLKQYGFEAGVAGKGDKLALTKADARQSRLAPQADKNPADNLSGFELTVTGKNGADLAAVGSTATGKAGADVKVTAGVKNIGKAALDTSRAGIGAAVTAVYAPKGTTFKTIPEDVCNRVEGNAAKVECDTDVWFVPGDKQTYEFTLHIDKVVVDAKGVVAVNETCKCERFLGDINKANDKATILVNKKTTVAATGGTGAGTSNTPSLPITGPAVLGTFLSGLLMVGLGVAALWFTRRRTA